MNAEDLKRLEYAALRDTIRQRGTLRASLCWAAIAVWAALALGEGRGVALLAAALAGLPVRQYPPATVKKAVTGRGAAPKEQVGAMVRVILGLPTPPEPADAADALAVAICALHRG